VPWKKQFFFRFTLALLAGMIIISAISWLGIVTGSVFNEQLITLVINEFNNEWIKMVILSFFIVLIYQAAYFSIYSYQQYAVVQLRRLREDRDQLRLQFDALKSQLSPHFLFNSLNTISSLVHKDPDSAEEFIRRLATTYQYVISNKQERLVSVQEEIEFIKSYYHLLKVRFEDSLKLEINLPKSIMRTVIPPLTLQILVENAVKHNQIDEMNRLDIYIGSIDNSFLTVTNNKGDKPPNVKSFKVGLENIKKRYAFYSDRAIKIDDAHQFSVELPVIPMKNAV
jgi:LytS/YehU family sensor histidine kinase